MSLDALVDQEASLIKRGELVVLVTFHRSRTKPGTLVHVKTVPAVEEFFRYAGGNDETEVGAYGRYWQPHKTDALVVYELASDDLRGVLGSNGGRYRLDQPGTPLRDGNIVNLSLLRLKGTSEAGVTFLLSGMHSKSYIEDLADAIVEASRDFYVNYLKPVDIAVMVSTQDLSK
jgi:hypothetical protein